MIDKSQKPENLLLDDPIIGAEPPIFTLTEDFTRQNPERANSSIAKSIGLLPIGNYNQQQALLFFIEKAIEFLNDALPATFINGYLQTSDETLNAFAVRDGSNILLFENCKLRKYQIIEHHLQRRILQRIGYYNEDGVLVREITMEPQGITDSITITEPYQFTYYKFYKREQSGEYTVSYSIELLQEPPKQISPQDFQQVLTRIENYNKAKANVLLDFVNQNVPGVTGIIASYL
jgi:hypothetical protein